MKFSEIWLRQFVDLPTDRGALEHRLNMIGHEVEGIERLGEGLDGVVVGQILACEPHPNADKLRLCRVAAGGAEPLQIVCGAPNARAGLKAPLAMIGARLPGGTTIRAAQLRGVNSQGMLCSAKELGLDADASGLWELPADAPNGTPLAGFLDLPDAVFNLGLTPNRADCLSMEGLARDLAAAFATPLRPVAVDAVAILSGRQIEVRLDAGADCPRYCGRVIEGVDAAARTPVWMSERLRRAGLRPHSLLVDVTNYVMLELGQPLHAFDMALLRGPIGVRRARAGEVLKLLDERELGLDPEFLLITNADRPVALAGVMGGYHTRVTATTREVFLEAAHFAPAAISGRARKLGMQTDAAHRFERGVDPELPRRALERATALILQLAGGLAARVTEAALPEHLPRPAAVPLRRARIERVLGIVVPDADVVRILRDLGMRVETTAEGWRAAPPGRRFDIAIEEDLIEEVVRIHGYDAVPTTMPSGEIRMAAPSEARLDAAELRRQLAARDWREAITYAFLDRNTLARWGLDADAVALANPLSADLAVMRTALLPGLTTALIANRRRQQARIRLFELGRVFRRGADGPHETLRFAGAAFGSAEAEQWALSHRALDFHDIKGDVEALLAMTGAPEAAFHFGPAGKPWLHPGRSAALWRGEKPVGVLGALHPRLLDALDLQEDVYAFELDLEPLLERALPQAAVLSPFPSLRRDIAVLLPVEVPYAAVERAVRDAVGATLREVAVFDQYLGSNLGTGVKSLAIGLILQDSSRTLVDVEADRCVALAVAALERECKARLRG